MQCKGVCEHGDSIVASYEEISIVPNVCDAGRGKLGCSKLQMGFSSVADIFHAGHGKAWTVDLYTVIRDHRRI